MTATTAPLTFRRMPTANGPVYRAVSADGERVYRAFRTAKPADGTPVHAWTVQVWKAATIGDLVVCDGVRPHLEHYTDSLGDAKAYAAGVESGYRA
jgi:hypothetical protein